MDSSVYVFVEDLRGEGVERVLDRISGYGVARRHRRRRAPRLPRRHPARTVQADHPPGRGALRPAAPTCSPACRLRPAAGYQDALDGLREACPERGLELHGWTVFLRNATLGAAHPDVTVRDCFGDRGSPADLCPAHPDVRAVRRRAGQGGRQARRRQRGRRVAALQAAQAASAPSCRSGRWTPTCSACASATTACAGPPTWASTPRWRARSAPGSSAACSTATRPRRAR